MWINKELIDYALSLKGDLVRFFLSECIILKKVIKLYLTYMSYFIVLNEYVIKESYKKFIGKDYKNKE
ncbi:hypothetical protein P5F43_15730 [Clostridium perfringens]|nr:hypothetical protein [Clostridium perfringens]